MNQKENNTEKIKNERRGDKKDWGEKSERENRVSSQRPDVPKIKTQIWAIVYHSDGLIFYYLKDPAQNSSRRLCKPIVNTAVPFFPNFIDAGLPTFKHKNKIKKIIIPNTKVINTTSSKH